MRLLLTALVLAGLAAGPALAKDKGKDAKPAGGASAIVLLSEECVLAEGCLFSGNDKSEDAIVQAYEDVFPLSQLSLAFAGKAEFSGQTYGGFWTSPAAVSFFSVKAGNAFMLYQLEAPSLSGAWSTAGLVNNKGTPHAVSHLSFWTGSLAAAAPPAPLAGTQPEPLPQAALAPPAPQFQAQSDAGPFSPILQQLEEPQVLQAAIPEPTTWISMILGFGAVGAVLRRRRALAA